ncbi:MAG: oxidoreductase [Bacteroidetes bacterium]|nr:oxidoreductase [Bacteroidota bacterium]
MAKTALIAGASGLTGSHCLDFLLNNDAYDKVISIGRNELKANHPKLEQIITDFSDLKEILPGLKADDVFCCLGTTIKKAGSKEAFKKVDYEYPLLIAKLAKANGAKGFHFVSAIGASADSFFFYSQVKGELEEEIMKVDFENANILRPSILDGDRKESRPAEKIGLMAAKFISPLLVGSFSKFKPTKAKAVGYVMVEMATKGIKGLSIIESDQIEQIYRKRR